jgi:hypothetical protein
MRRWVLVGSIALGALAFAGGTASGKSNVFVQFRTPTGNIGCGYDKFSGEPAHLRCDIGTGLRPRPGRPAGCDLDWGFGYAMGKTGRATVVCAGDTVLDRRAPVLRYGQTWRRDGFTCVSRSTGLTCTNLSGRGFFLSRQQSRLI